MSLNLRWHKTVGAINGAAVLSHGLAHPPTQDHVFKTQCILVFPTMLHGVECRIIWEQRLLQAWPVIKRKNGTRTDINKIGN